MSCGPGNPTPYPAPWHHRLVFRKSWAPGSFSLEVEACCLWGTSHLGRAVTSSGASPGPALGGLHPFLIRLPNLSDGDASPHNRGESFQRSRKASRETVPSLHLLLSLGEEKTFCGRLGCWGEGGSPRSAVETHPCAPPPIPTSPSWPGRPCSQAPGPTSCLADCVCSQRQGVDAIFQTSDQCVYILGARKFFQINTA